MVISECLFLLYCLLSPLKVPVTSTSGGSSDDSVTPHEQEALVNTGDLQGQAASQGMLTCNNFCAFLLSKLTHPDATNLGRTHAISDNVSLHEQAATQSQITNIQQNSLGLDTPASGSVYRTRSSTQSLPASKTRYPTLAPAPKTTPALQGNPAQASATDPPVKRGRGRGRPQNQPLQAAPQVPPPNPAATSGLADPASVTANSTLSSQAKYHQDIQRTQLQALLATGSTSTTIQATVPPSSSVSSVPIAVAPYPHASPSPAVEPFVQLSLPATSTPVQDPFHFQPATPIQLSLLNELQAIYEARFPTFSAFHRVYRSQYPDSRAIIAPLATWYPYTSSPGPDSLGAQPQYPPYGHSPFPLSAYFGRDLNYGPGMPSMTITGGPPMPCFQLSAAGSRADVGFGPGIEIADEFKALAERYAREHRREVVKGDKAVSGMDRME